MLHCLDAHEETLAILAEERVGEVGGIMHCFSGDVEIAFKKSAVMGLELPSPPRQGSATLLYFLKPGHLVRAARGR